MQLNLNKLNNFLFLGLIFLLPWHTIYIVREVFYNAEKWQYGTIGIYLSDITLILWISLSIYLYKKQILSFILQKQKLILIALLLSLWGFLSVLWADDKMLAFYFAIKLSLTLDLFFLIQVVPIQIQMVSFVFLMSAFLQNILGLWQFITQQTFSQKLLGLHAHNIWQGSTAIINTDLERWLRAYGGFPHPNIFGGFLLCTLIICLYLYITEKNILPKIFILLSIIFTTLNILFTFSRTTWLATFLYLFLLIIFIYKNNQKNLVSLISPLSFLFLTIIGTLFIYQNIFFDRLTQDTTISHNSISDRATYIEQSKLLIQNHPIVGTGISNYTNTVQMTLQDNSPIWNYQPVHNVYLLITSELGIIGIILFSIFIFMIFYDIYINKKNINLLQFIFILLLISLLFISIFDHWPWTSHFGIITLFLIAGLSLRNEKSTTISEM